MNSKSKRINPPSSIIEMIVSSPFLPSSTRLQTVGGGGTEEGKETDTSKQIAETYRDIYEKAAGEGKPRI